jgi:hypothetical protein
MEWDVAWSDMDPKPLVQPTPSGFVLTLGEFTNHPIAGHWIYAEVYRDGERFFAEGRYIAYGRRTNRFEVDVESLQIASSNASVVWVDPDDAKVTIETKH